MKLFYQLFHFVHNNRIICHIICFFHNFTSISSQNCILSRHGPPSHRLKPNAHETTGKTLEASPSLVLSPRLQPSASRPAATAASAWSPTSACARAATPGTSARRARGACPTTRRRTAYWATSSAWPRTSWTWPATSYSAFVLKSMPIYLPTTTVATFARSTSTSSQVQRGVPNPMPPPTTHTPYKHLMWRNIHLHRNSETRLLPPHSSCFDILKILTQENQAWCTCKQQRQKLRPDISSEGGLRRPTSTSRKKSKSELQT